ncbi:hypothetical protein ACH5RR_025114 [Cinchona calisaya]|uniref:Uncharacterized protein n=1 Tax=Cinchona calisaya TaxID=153742 RepID=A0ABD2YYP9_9GENT
MVRISFNHFVLGIMVLLLALKDCEAYNNRGIQKTEVEGGDGVMVQARKEIHNGKEILVDFRGDVEDISGILGGRKMMMKELSNEVMKKEENKKTNEETSKISVRRPKNVPNSDQGCLHKCTKADSISCRLKCSYVTKSTSVSKKSDHQDSESFQNLDSKKLLEAASHEIANLMNKDYPGGGGPGYRTPINNNEPLH